jgi:uncharacterized protein YkwD
VLLLQSCAGTQTVSAPPPPPDPQTEMPELEQRIFELIEVERLKIDPKAKVLMLDSELVGVARTHSTDMAEKHYFDHAGPDGRTTADIIMDKDADFQGLLGENIAAQHFSVGYIIDVDALAHRFVESWLASPPHKENLSFAAYDRSGVGAAVSGNTVYVTQLFAANLGLPPANQKSKSRQITKLPDTHSAGGSSAAPASSPNSPPTP